LCTRTIGVFPMASRIVSQIFRPGGFATSVGYQLSVIPRCSLAVGIWDLGFGIF
jgi:hypothetical protein